MKKSKLYRFSAHLVQLLVLATVMRFTALAQDSDTTLPNTAASPRRLANELEHPLQGQKPPLPPLELPVARTQISFQKVKHAQTGDLYVIQKTRYEDGTTVQTLAAVWLDQPIALEILVLDDFVPAPRLQTEENLENAQNKSTRESDPAQAALLPERLTVDFDPSWKLDIIATPNYIQTELAMSNPVTLSELGACPQGQLRGLARFHTSGFEPLLPPKRAAPEIANFVCLRKVP